MSKDTDALIPKGVMVKVGSHRLTIPLITIAMAILGAAGTTWRIIAADRDAVLCRVAALERSSDDFSRKLELEQVVLAEIRTQLARIDARVAEVQVTLMRSGRP